MKVLGLIPARGGSKGIPNKNLKPLLGRSLVGRAFDCAGASGVVDRLILSTDCEEIFALAEEIGLEAPFRRPPELSGDATAMIDVVLHALDALVASEGYQPDAVLVLQPTSPLRRPQHLVHAVSLLQEDPTAHAVCSVVALPKASCPHYLMQVDDDGIMTSFMADGHRYTRRQDVPQAWQRCGTVFLTKTAVLRSKRDFYGDRCLALVLPAEETLNIDEPEDWKEAEARISLVENR